MFRPVLAIIRLSREYNIHEYKPDNNAICGGGGCSRQVWRCSRAAGGEGRLGSRLPCLGEQRCVCE